MKKLISFITSIAMCMMFVMPVSAAEITPKGETVIATEESDSSVYATNYFRKITKKLNSAFGNPSEIATLSSGSVTGSDPQITSVTLYSRVSSGSDPFYLYVVDPNGYLDYFLVSSSGTITTNDFNGLDLTGEWKIWIETAGDVSTATITLTVNYKY